MQRLKSIVENHSGTFSSSDERIIKELLSAPQETALISAAELAARVGVHESTVVRLAQKLGYSGYRELRSDLQSEFLDTLNPAGRVLRRLEHTGDLASLVEGEIAALRALVTSVSQEQIDAAARLIIQARCVYLFAQGHATALVELMDRRLRRAGYATADLRYRGRDLAEHLTSLGAEDVVLTFAFHVRPPGLEPLLAHAQSIGVSTVLVSDALGPLVSPRPDILLAARRGAKSESNSLLVPMAICDALLLSIARLDDGHTIQSLEQLSDLIRRYEEK